MDLKTRRPKYAGAPSPPTSIWTRLERFLPGLALAFGLTITVVLAWLQHTQQHQHWSEEYDEIAATVVTANANTAELAEARADHLLELADRIETLPDRSAAQVLAGLGPDVTVRAPALLGAAVPGPDGGDLGATDDRLLAILAENPELADQLMGLADNAENGGEPYLFSVPPIAALAVETGSGPVALLLEEESFLGTNPRVQTWVTTTITSTSPDLEPPATATGTDPTSTADGHLGLSTSLDILGSRLLIDSTSNDPLAGAPTILGGWMTILLGMVGAGAAFAVVRWLVVSQLAALDAASVAQAARRDVDARFRTSFERSPMGIAEIDQAGLFVDANPALCRQVGIPRQKLLGQPVGVIVHDADRAAYRSKFAAVAGGTTDAARSEHRYFRPDGTTVWVDESLSVISDAEGRFRCLLLQAQDITTRREATSQLARQAFHDELTGLPNRALFLNRLRQGLQRISRFPGFVTVMFIDVDRFKVINDSLGHETGDRFLSEIATRLTQAVRTGDTVARFGGDEFVVLCENVDGPSEAHYIANRIQTALASPYALEKATIDGASASIGITICDSEQLAAEELLRDADAAMYRAKENGRNRVELFDASLRREVVARMEIEAQLRRALENGEMVLHFQAIVDSETELPSGYEALIRWNHPEKGLLAPSAFLHVAEEAGVMHLIDSFALRQTCRQIAEWSAHHPSFRRMYVSTNWSARRLEQYVALTEQVLGETHIDPNQLVIEVTEGFLLEDSEGSMNALRRLKELGVRVAIDDFGTGYSSLSYLTRLDVDFLKIDRSFVIQLPDPASAAIIRAIADMASRLNMGLIVEGVESEEQLAFLRSIGSPRLQGYRFSKPRWAAEIDESMAERFAMSTTATVSLT